MKLTKLPLILGTLLSFVACTTDQEAHTQEKEGEEKAPISAKADLSVLQTSPFVQNFVTHFKTQSLPYSPPNQYTLRDTIPAEVVVENILEAAEEVESPVFDVLWGDKHVKELTRKGLKDRFIDISRNRFAVVNFGYLKKLNLNDNYYSLVFHYIPSYMEGQYMYTYLANYTKKGEFIDAVHIGGLEMYVDMETEWNSEITQEGIEVTSKTVKRGEIHGTSEDFIETAALNYEVQEDGQVLLIKADYSGFSGKFKDIKSKEVVLVDEFPNEVIISYRNSKEYGTEKQLEVVNVDKKKNWIIAKYPGSNESCVLKYDKNKAAFSCKGFHGKSQIFKRF